MLCRAYLKDVTLKTHATSAEGMTHLISQDVVDNKKCFAVVADDTYIRVWAHLHPEHQLAVIPITGTSTKDGLGIAMRKGDPDFLAWINLLLDEIEGNGMLDELKGFYIRDLSWMDAKRSQ